MFWPSHGLHQDYSVLIDVGLVVHVETENDLLLFAVCVHVFDREGFKPILYMSYIVGLEGSLSRRGFFKWETC